jgi:integrase
MAQKYTQFGHYTLYKRGNRWHYYYYEGHKRVRKSTGKARKSDALDVISQLMEAKGKSHKTFREYADPFFIWETCPRVKRRLDEGKTIGKTHVKKSRAWLKNYVFKDPIFPHLQISAIRRADILDLRNRLRKKAGINTVNKVISTVKTILSEAHFREDIAGDPGAKIGIIKHEKKERGILSADELSFLFKNIPGVWDSLLAYCVFNTAAKTGLRCGEVLALTWGAIDFQNEVLDISQAWKDRQTLGLPKSNKKRKIPVSSTVTAPLLHLQEESIRIAEPDLMFCYDDGSRLGVTWWKKAFTRAMDAAEKTEKACTDWSERNVTPHSLRHSLNSHLLAGGADPIKVRAYMGWSDNVFQPILTPVQAGYTRWPPEHLRDLVPAIDKIFSTV